METTKTCSSKSFISLFFTCQVSACELQPFSCHDLANDIYSQTAKTVYSHLKWKTKVLLQKAQHKLTSRSVFPLPPFFRRFSTVFFTDTKQTKLFHSISEMFSTFLTRKTLRQKLFSLNVCEAALQAARKGGNFGAKLTHLCGFWLDASFFSHVKKHRSRFWLEVSFFSSVKTIFRSSDWLELICVRKFTT